WALTDSRPSADVTLIILRVANLAAALPVERRVLACRDGRLRKVAFLTSLRVIVKWIGLILRGWLGQPR
ncbi:MAG TPA: hypothetical protein VN039_07570, partial [Nitrospira sp.]|nr:hypothetical protein [Nitrospira sp.]